MKTSKSTRGEPGSAMRTRVISTVVCTALALASLPLAGIGFAGTDVSALVNAVENTTTEEWYETLQEAIDKAEADNNIKLEADLQQASTISIGSDKSVVIDLNGHTLNITGKKDGITVYNTLDLKDSIGNGSVVSGRNGIYACASSKVTIDSGTVNSTEFAVCGGPNSKNAAITINGGTFKTSDNCVLGFSGNDTAGGNTLTVNGGNFVGNITTAHYIACGIYVPNDDTVVVNGGEFLINGGAGIVARAGSTTVKGGTFKCSANPVYTTGWVGDNKNLVPCSALVFDVNANYPGLNENSAIKIEGGTFITEGTTIEAAPVIQTIGDCDQRICVTGGTFSNEPAAEFISEGYAASAADGKYTVARILKEIDAIELSCDSATAGSRAPEVTVKSGDTVLTADTDYKLIWSPSLDMNTAGTYKVTANAVSGSGYKDKETPASAILTVAAAIPTPVEKITLGGEGHVQDIGNETNSYDEKTGILTVGTEGQAKRLEAITINVGNIKDITGYDGTLMYQVHVQNIGWMDPVKAGETAGTEGQSLRIEAVRIWLEGDVAKHYSVQYLAHVRDYGSAQGWVSDGAVAGTTGESKRLEELKIKIVPLDSASETTVSYRTHIQDIGWENKWSTDGEVSGTIGQAKRLEGIKLTVNGNQYQGGIEYMTYIQDIGWQDSVTSGALSGTQGMSRRLEAIKINLTGELAEHYDVYYRVHVQDIGWLAWAKNGETSGTMARAARLEGIQIVLVAKGSDAPATTFSGVTSAVEYASKNGF